MGGAVAADMLFTQGTTRDRGGIAIFLSFPNINECVDYCAHHASGYMARFIGRFDPAVNTGDYMYHCHILEHEDAGMMGFFRIEQ